MVTNIKLYKLKKSDFSELLPLVTDIRVMKHIGNNKVWSSDKLSKLLEFSEKDWIEPNKAKYLYWKIKLDKKLIGIVSLHVFPVFKNKLKFQSKMISRSEIEQLNKEYFVTRFIHKKYQGKGYGTEALNKAILKFKKIHPNITYIYSAIHNKNIPSNKSIIKAGFNIYTSVKIRNSNYNIYRKEIRKRI